jgi:5-methylcytosine-specific restriction endonuclease McrA
VILPSQKPCTRCNRVLPLDAFGLCRREKDGRQDWCKACKREHYLANREAVLARCWEYRLSNPAAKKARDREYYLRNADRVRARAKAYRQENIERVRAYDRSDARKGKARLLKANARAARWAKANPHRRLASYAKRRALLRGLPAAEVVAVEAFYRHVKTAPRLVCHWCRRVTPKRLRHVDHIVPLARGGAHELANLCCACRDCNLSKGRRTPDEFTGMRSLW